MRIARGLLPLVAAGALLGAAPAPTGLVGTLNLRLAGDLTPVHDPVIIREKDRYYVFGTSMPNEGGRFITSRSSPDLVNWTKAASLIDRIPAWAEAAVPGTKGMWAPDISFVNGRYRLYYAVSTFGSNRSAVGLFTSPTLDPAAPGYGWRDEGLVVQSTERDDFNAIDPNLVIDAAGGQWLALGSFWSGLKLFRLDPATGKPARGTRPIAIARRPVPVGAPDTVEAPFIILHGGAYWLLASYDYCCKGVNSTYYTVIGRSKSVTGPYLGKDGSSMLEGGGTVLLRADLQEQQRWRGPGHAGFLHDRDGTDYVVYHAYDRQNKGAPTLRIAPLRWGADGWPTAEQ
ncbi:arabinan endo-1,5-alpha-L-arabinosidase [Sphingomonas ginkgonis]|uniref:Extracellular exo-alpha-(1->5)-L-arabinofuranosidase n=1 Tax=Sphingomonas ginkgonis TaxID=2315330 RepID=A0A3S0EN81_9SPHN|nr:arabinan endo-1,5-alpha-L-arabinosidase [Sphingomonas ginkgonis]RST31428.1 arabinan endo-1,5-alpha-L-arabinosidase [Sphingomonas ginkgonis]